MAFPDWTRRGGWRIDDNDAPKNPWNLGIGNILKFEGAGIGSAADVIKNMTKAGATEATNCHCNTVNPDEVVVKHNNGTEYTITRSVTATGATLTCDGGTSGGASWTAVEG
jgi:hypothetical protein